MSSPHSDAYATLPMHTFFTSALPNSRYENIVSNIIFHERGVVTEGGIGNNISATIATKIVLPKQCSESKSLRCR